MIFPSCWPTVNGFSGKQEHLLADIHRLCSDVRNGSHGFASI